MRARIRLVLVLAVAVLGCVLAWQLLAPVDTPDVTPAALPARHDAVAKVPPFVPPPESAFGIINARAAFAPDRGPVAEPEATLDSSAASPPQVTLIGVAIGPGKSVALLKPFGGGAAISAEIGRMVDGWELARIESNRVVFRANGTDYAVNLRVATGLTPLPPRTDQHQ